MANSRYGSDGDIGVVSTISQQAGTCKNPTVGACPGVKLFLERGHSKGVGAPITDWQDTEMRSHLFTVLSAPVLSSYFMHSLDLLEAGTRGTPPVVPAATALRQETNPSSTFTLAEAQNGGTPGRAGSTASVRFSLPTTAHLRYVKLIAPTGEMVDSTRQSTYAFAFPVQDMVDSVRSLLRHTTSTETARDTRTPRLA